MAKPVIQNKRVEVTLSVMLLVAGLFLLWDSSDHRGDDPPWFLRWITFW